MILKLGSFRATIVTSYNGLDRPGLNRFANGYSYRVGRTVFRVWRLKANDYVPTRL